MKQGHLTLIYITLFVSCFFFLMLEQRRYDNVQKEKQKIEQALLEAIEQAGRCYTAALFESDENKLKIWELAFWRAFYVSIGAFEDKAQQELLVAYLPLMIIAQENGAYFYHLEEKKINGTEQFLPVWSEKINYSYSQGCSVAEKKIAVAETLESEATKIITNHNYIAEQYGISYSFSVPKFLLDTSESLEFPMVFVAFQGWPLTAAEDIVYENCIDAGAYLKKVVRYVVTGPVSILDTRSLYHERGCSKIRKEEIISGDGDVTLEEAIRNFGAVPCDSCIKE